jgi:hypothetical protein
MEYCDIPLPCQFHEPSLTNCLEGGFWGPFPWVTPTLASYHGRTQKGYWVGVGAWALSQAT